MLRDASRRGRGSQALAKGSLPACTGGITIDITAEYDKGAQNVPPSLFMSWTVNGVDETAIFVQGAEFGFIVDEAKNYAAGTTVEYGANQRSFSGSLEVSWILSVPTAAAKAYLRLNLRDSTGNQTQCGTEIPISNRL